MLPIVYMNGALSTRMVLFFKFCVHKWGDFEKKLYFD